MAVSRGFTDFVVEQLEGCGVISTKRMFGGVGIYCGDTFFALIANDVLYLKADETLAAAFISRDLPPFEYQQSGKKITLQYYQAPAEVLDDPEQAA